MKRRKKNAHKIDIKNEQQQNFPWKKKKTM